MKLKEIETIFKKVVDGKMITVASLLRIDGKVIYSYNRNTLGPASDLIARESYSAKMRRSIVFSSLGDLFLA